MIAVNAKNVQESQKRTTNSDEERMIVSPTQLMVVFRRGVTAAAEGFIAKWNSRNPTEVVDIRFILTKHKIRSHPKFKAQVILNFEMKIGFQWNVMSRTTAELTKLTDLEDKEAEYTFEVWAKMFDEITQIGFSAVYNTFNGKENNQSSTASGNIKAVENEGE